MKRIYPWELWLNGEEWVLVRGEDFEVSSHGMQATVYTYVARNCEGTLKSWRDRDFLSIQFVPVAQQHGKIAGMDPRDVEQRAIELYLDDNLPHDLPWAQLSESTREGYLQRAENELKR